MAKEKELVIAEIEDLPTPFLQEVLDFVRFLKGKIAQKRLETALLSEPSLSRDWLRPEEDEAWRGL
jgi:hypothetical protein